MIWERWGGRRDEELQFQSHFRKALLQSFEWIAALICLAGIFKCLVVLSHVEVEQAHVVVQLCGFFPQLFRCPVSIQGLVELFQTMEIDAFQ